jgi:hypothetical protein
MQLPRSPLKRYDVLCTSGFLFLLCHCHYLLYTNNCYDVIFFFINAHFSLVFLCIHLRFPVPAPFAPMRRPSPGEVGIGVCPCCEPQLQALTGEGSATVATTSAWRQCSYGPHPLAGRAVRMQVLLIRRGGFSFASSICEN